MCSGCCNAYTPAKYPPYIYIKNTIVSKRKEKKRTIPPLFSPQNDPESWGYIALVPLLFSSKKSVNFAAIKFSSKLKIKKKRWKKNNMWVGTYGVS